MNLCTDVGSNMDEIRQSGTCRAPGNTRTRSGMGTALSIKERLLSKVIILAVHIHRYAGLPDCLSVPRSAGGTPAIRSHEYTKQMFGKGRRAGGEGGGAQRGYAACLSQGRRHLARSAIQRHHCSCNRQTETLQRSASKIWARPSARGLFGIHIENVK